MFSFRFMLFPTLQKKNWCRKNKLGGCGFFLYKNNSFSWGGGGGVMCFSHFMLFPTFLEKKSGNTNLLFLI